MPENSRSPTRLSGRAPDHTSMVMAAAPMAAQTGTASATSTTKRITDA